MVTISAALFTSALLVCHRALANDNLHVKYQWNIIDFKYPTEDERRNAVHAKSFIPENNIPVAIEIYKNRLFVTVPRFKHGVAASLAYINLTESSESPVFYPFPNWEAHKSVNGAPPEIISPLRIRIDRCDRLWVLDTGVKLLWDKAESEIRKLPENEVIKPQLLVYNLLNDTLAFSYQIPDDQLSPNSLLANIAVEDTDCDDTFAYLADVKRSRLIVYSHKNKRSWMVKHNYFHISPTAGDMNVSGIEFVSDDGIFALALSAADKQGFSTLYFHPMASFEEFSVSTKVLRNESLATSSENYHMFKYLGSRGPRGQSGVSFLDQKSDVLFYASVNLNAVVCWRTTSKAYIMHSQGRIFMNESMMVYPSDIKVDLNDNLWVLSNKLPVFLHYVLDYEQVNFRILMAPVKEAINNTACDSKLVVDPDIMIKVLNVTNLNATNFGLKLNRGYNITSLTISGVRSTNNLFSIGLFIVLFLIVNSVK